MGNMNIDELLLKNYKISIDDLRNQEKGLSVDAEREIKNLDLFQKRNVLTDFDLDFFYEDLSELFKTTFHEVFVKEECKKVLIGDNRPTLLEKNKTSLKRRVISYLRKFYPRNLVLSIREKYDLSSAVFATLLMFPFHLNASFFYRTFKSQDKYYEELKSLTEKFWFVSRSSFTDDFLILNEFEKINPDQKKRSLRMQLQRLKEIEDLYLGLILDSLSYFTHLDKDHQVIRHKINEIYLANVKNIALNTGEESKKSNQTTVNNSELSGSETYKFLTEIAKKKIMKLLGL